MLLDDFSSSELASNLGTRWRAVSDAVMGGISQAAMRYDRLDGRRCLRLTGEVRLENNGGFIQMALDLADSGRYFDASDFKGLRVTVRGNGERYSAHLRTSDTARPWESYRFHFRAAPVWEEIDLPFEQFQPHRVKATLDVKRLRRLGLVAIGRRFDADLAVSKLSLYR